MLCPKQIHVTKKPHIIKNSLPYSYIIYNFGSCVDLYQYMWLPPHLTGEDMWELTDLKKLNCRFGLSLFFMRQVRVNLV